MVKRIILYPGQEFGRLTVVEYLGAVESASGKKQGMAKCECSCEARTIQDYIVSNLVKGITKSCGCIKKEKPPAKTHGMVKTPEYRAWSHMKNRCFRVSDGRYKNYGARGITVCDRWKNSFEAFYEDMGNRSDGLSLDRVNTDMHYSCGRCNHCRSMEWKFNCRWADTKTQSRNRTNNRRYEWNDQEITLAELGEIGRKDPDLIRERILRGWSIEDAVKVPENVFHNYKKGIYRR